MSNIFQDYQAQKVKEVMLYILNKAGDTGYFRLMKTMFCADRQNLLKWGDQITELDYFARKHGPVPTSVHDGLLSVYQGTESEFSDILTVCVLHILYLIICSIRIHSFGKGVYM